MKRRADSMLFRDDDINIHTDSGLFRQVHELFNKYGKTHTIAVEMENLWDNKFIFYYIAMNRNIKIGLHGWTHRDYSKLSYDECCADIGKSLKYWYENRNRMLLPEIAAHESNRIDTFYPPWNRVSDSLKKACEFHGLKVDARCTLPEVFNFHFWTMFETHRIKELEELLKK